MHCTTCMISPICSIRCVSERKVVCHKDLAHTPTHNCFPAPSYSFFFQAVDYQHDPNKGFPAPLALPPPSPLPVLRASTTASWFLACAAAMPKVTAKIFALNFVSNFPLRLAACAEVASQRTTATLAASRALQSAPFKELLRNSYAAGIHSSGNNDSSNLSSGDRNNNGTLAAVLQAVCEAVSEESDTKRSSIIDEVFVTAQSSDSWPALVSTCRRLSSAVEAFEAFMVKEERSAKYEGALPPLSAKVLLLRIVRVATEGPCLVALIITINASSQQYALISSFYCVKSVHTTCAHLCLALICTLVFTF